MTGLVSKDFIVFKKQFGPLYRAASALLLIAVILLLPNDGARYIALCLPMMGVAVLTEIVKAEEQSDWKDYLPVLPITNRDIVLSRYMFCALLLAAISVISFAACAASAAIHQFTLADVMPSYVLGAWFGVLFLCAGIPSGYFFKNEICTSAMMWCLIPIGLISNSGMGTAFLRTGSPAAIMMVLLVTALMLYASYALSLWIYTTKRYQKMKMRTAKRA
ncbi:MAG: ABC-2 transporter permease [Clostridiales bacterium]|nr:ABC-2 transporter permease [Clostridiales bacterium]